jgi:hypothetical protein
VSGSGGSGGPPGDGGGGAPGAGEGGASGPLTCNGPGERFVTGVVDHAFGPGQSLGQDRFPEVIFGPPKGGGCCQGSTDTVSLGNGGFVIVEFAGNEIVDGPGPDFIVFENAFYASGDENSVFAELATVSVSADGVTWHTFPCDAVGAPYGTCAGWKPVYANADTNDIDPLDPAVAGGDAFDLADLGIERARYVRIVDRPDLEGFNGVFDLDAVGIVHAACP